MASRVPLPTKLPVVHYLRCKGAGRRPVEHVGDWPKRGQVYPCDVRPSAETGEPHVYVHGFYAQHPFGAFKAWRFRWVATVWLN